MIHRLQKYGFKLALFCFIMILVSACGKVDLVPAFYRSYQKVATTVNFCTSDSAAVKTHLKFLFIVDRSASNQGINGAPTDFLGNRRFGAITQFVRSFPITAGNEDFVWFSQINFADKELRKYEQPFTNDRTKFLNYVAKEKANTYSRDTGATNYTSALGRAREIINADIQSAKLAEPIISSSYIIFFLSDGAPLYPLAGVMTPQSQSTVLNRVASIKDLENATGNNDVVDSILLSTIYYYNTIDNNAENMMRSMALAGEGQFIKSEAGDVIDFNRFTLPSLNLRFTLQEIWVQNVSNTWLDGFVRRDTDMDGLPDEEELRLGSDPLVADTDGDGVRDGLLQKTTGAPCSNLDFDTIGCIRPGSPDWPKSPPIQCASLGTPPFKDSDGDYLNDCEEKVLKSNWRDGDSNKDFIPDALALFNDIKVSDPSYATTLDPDFDDLSDYQELKYNLPVRHNNIDLTGSVPMRYVGELISSDDQEDCHQYNIHDLVTTSGNDTLRVYLFESSFVSERRLIRTAEKTMVNGGAHFTNEDFNYLESPK